MELSKLVEEKKDLEQKLTEIKGQVLQGEKERLRECEIVSIEGKIREKQTQIEEARMEDARAKMTPLEEAMKSLIREEEDIDRRKEEIRIQKILLVEKTRSIVPLKKKQISSHQFVKMEREIELPIISFSISVNPVIGPRHPLLGGGIGEIGVTEERKAVINKEKKYEETMVDAFPPRILRMKKAGWRLKKGEVILPEPLDGDNSILVPIVSIPAILQ